MQEEGRRKREGDKGWGRGKERKREVRQAK